MAKDENSTVLTRPEFERLRREYMCGAPIRKGWQIQRDGEVYLLTMREIDIIQGKEDFPADQRESGFASAAEFLDIPSTDDKPNLRDQLAMAAPHEEIEVCLLAAGEQRHIELVCKARYEWADAMLAARKPK